MNTSNIPVRGNSGESTVETASKDRGSHDDAWDTYASEMEQQRDAAAKEAVNGIGEAPKTEELLAFMDTNPQDSVWDNPRLQGFFSFVTTKIEQMSDFKKDIRDIHNVTLQELNVALFNHNETYNSLVSLYNIAATEEESVKLDFQIWFDEKYTQMRNRVNIPNLSSQKWASTREIEAMVRAENKAEYKTKRMDVIASERQTAFCRRLMDGWDGMKFSLSTISKNQQIQYRDAGTEDRFTY